MEGHMMPDHIHMLVSIPPRLSVSSLIGRLERKSALMMFDRRANLEHKLGNRHFWIEGYYVSTAGLSEKIVARYVREREQHDIAFDRLGVKEYTNPFGK